MSRKDSLLLIVALLLCVSLGPLLSIKILAAQTTQPALLQQRTTAGAGQIPPRWEYRILADNSGEYGASRNYDVLQSKINQLAEQGFEVDSVEASSGIQGGGAPGSGFNISGRSTIVVVLRRERK